MATANEGASIQLEPNSFYLRFSFGEGDEDEGVSIMFNVMNTMDAEDDRAQFMNCVVRGFMEIFADDPDGVANIGKNSFAREALATVPDPVATQGGGDDDSEGKKDKPSNVIDLLTARPLGNA